MLDVNNVLPTPKSYRKMKIINVSKTTTKTKDENENENEDENEDERRKRRRSKRTVERRKLIFKTNVLVPKTNVIRKGEGATVAASHLPSLSWLSSGRTGSVLQRTPILWERVINYRKCPTNETPAIFRLQIKQKDAAESDRKIRLIT